MQLQAGYIIDEVKDLLQEEFGTNQLNKLLEYLCYFEVETQINFNNYNEDSIYSVLSNLISRGLPTRMSLDLEETFLEVFKIGNLSENLGTISCKGTSKLHSLLDAIFNALHIIDPRLYLNRINCIKGDSSFEKQFLFDCINNENNFLIQMLEGQRSFEQLTRTEGFTNQRVDFVLDDLYTKKGLIVEVDGNHINPEQINLDRRRDATAKESGWNVLRSNSLADLRAINAVINNPYFAKIKENYSNKHFSEDRLDALQIALSPYAITRLQKVILELLLNNALSINDKTWNITVIERDVPCAKLALIDLRNQIKHLYRLQGNDVVLPKLNLKILNTEAFKEAKLNKQNETILLSGKQSANCDILIDISMLQRLDVMNDDIDHIKHKHYLKIRSSYCIHSTRRFYTTDIISYQQLATQNNEIWTINANLKKSLTYFLQGIFRKRAFREGQVPILSRALQGQSVIGLLPTGGGKSLTYQLAALLQPGVTLVIDPLRSLMKDQVDNLIKNKIDACVFINSTLKTPQERKTATAKMQNAEVLFVFIAPERLQIPEFRDALINMNQQGIYFAYAVIDEAHCVSEWGHDFRLSYLGLGQNAMTFAKTKNLPALPLFGLTATASFDVLTDVQRELSGKQFENKIGQEAIVRAGNTDRKELRYYIIPVDAYIPTGANDWKYKECIAIAKKGRINQILQKYNERHFFNTDCKQSGLIFCPHRRGHFGVTDKFELDRNGNPVLPRKGIADSITNIANLKLGVFVGSSDENTVFKNQIEEEAFKSQEDFIDNELNVLVATKAFGMGIDKPNIRFTMHINYPNSLESFVQEAGRAGRDGEPADCFILFNQQKHSFQGKELEVDKDNLLYFHNNSFKGTAYEKEMIDNFLTEIVFSKTSEIVDLISDTFDIEVQTSIWQSTSGVWYLSLQKEFGQKYANIRLSDLQVYDDQSVDQKISKMIVPIVLNYIRQNTTTNNRLSFLQSGNTAMGIERRINELRIGENCEITINSRTQWSEKISADKADTEKMIYRLSTIGIIDDYEVLFNEKVFILYATRKTDEQYIANLRSYIEQYYSDQIAENEIKKLANYQGSTIKKCLHFLIDFVYREIAQKRKLAIDTMKQACLEGLKDNGTEETRLNGSKTFREFLDYYFRSKYARKGYQENGQNQSLSDRTTSGRMQSPEWVWEFIKITKGNIENLKHLRGACLRMLQDQPQNATLLLLKSFAVFILEADNINSEIMNDAIENFSRGVENFEVNFKSSEKVKDDFLDKYKEYLLEYSKNPNIQNVIDEVINGYRLHKLLSSIKKINNKYLTNYGN